MRSPLRPPPELPADARFRRFRRRTEHVLAYQIHFHTRIPTLDGMIHAHPGDWIVRGPLDDWFVLDDRTFRFHYEEIEDR